VLKSNNSIGNLRAPQEICLKVLHDGISQKTANSIITAVRTSNPKRILSVTADIRTRNFPNAIRLEPNLFV
jgi:hypothetical protein